MSKLESLVKDAMKKVNASKENDICRYLPFGSEGYIHHFTMRKMKGEDPVQLTELITKYIINAKDPKKVKPKSRAARGSRKRRDQFIFSKNDMDQLLEMARRSGNIEMIRKLTPRKDLRTLKRELISSIKHGRVEHHLWTSYAELMTAQQQIEAAINGMEVSTPTPALAGASL